MGACLRGRESALHNWQDDRLHKLIDRYQCFPETHAQTFGEDPYLNSQMVSAIIKGNGHARLDGLPGKGLGEDLEEGLGEGVCEDLCEYQGEDPVEDLGRIWARIRANIRVSAGRLDPSSSEPLPPSPSPSPSPSP